MPWPLRRGRRALTVAVGGEAVGTWPWKRSRRAVALEARLSSRGLGGEEAVLWPWRRGRRAVAVELYMAVGDEAVEL